MHSNLKTEIISISFWLGPLLMFITDLLLLIDSTQFYWISSILFWLSFYTFIFIIFGMLQLSHFSNYAVISSMIALLGVLIGITIIGMSRLAWGVEMEGVSREFITLADTNSIIFFTSRFPGITFPVGLIMLVIALKRNKVINGYLLIGLIISILLFPLGRIPGELIVNVVGDGLMVIFFGLVGKTYLNKMNLNS